VITSSSSSELLTTFRNLLAPLAGLLALGERGRGGIDDDDDDDDDDATGFLVTLGF
jgi:hypothetical protein